MAETYIVGSETIPMKQTEGNILDYKMLNYYVVAVRTDVIYAQDIPTKKIYRSTDGGNNWIGPLATLSEVVRVGVVTDKGILVFVGNGGTIFKSTDSGLTFNNVKTIFAPLVNAMDVKGETIIIAEYNVGAGSYTLNVWKSTDAGSTWNSMMTKTSDEITHFHTVKYIRELNTWVLTSGDSGIFWWTSKDDGVTWTLIAEGDKYRAVGVTNTPTSTVVWGADNNKGQIYAGDLNNLKNTTRKVGTIPGHCLGIAGDKNTIVLSTRIETGGQKGTLTSPIFVSPDAGATWVKDYYVTSKVENAGSWGVLGPDKNGNFYMQFTLLEESSVSHSTIRATQKKNVSTASAPIKYEYTDVPFSETIHDKAELRNTTTKWMDTAMTEAIYEPMFYVLNQLDAEVNIRLSFGSGPTLRTDGTIMHVKIPAGMNMFISGDELLAKGRLSVIPANTQIGLAATTVPTSGSATLRVFGTARRPKDHRVIS